MDSKLFANSRHKIISYGGAMKVTFEVNNSPEPEVRWQRILDIIRRDLEKRSVLRYSQPDVSAAALPLPDRHLLNTHTGFTSIVQN